MMAEIAPKLPKLLKARQLHSRMIILLLVPLLLFSIGYIHVESALHEVMDWVGYFLVIFGVMGRIYSTAFIGGIKNETVVRDGPFSVVRNPLYVFSFIALIGIGIQSGILTVVLVLAGVFMLYYPLVVKKEEAFLVAKFGEEYLTYMREVPRWLPRFSLWKTPDAITVRPQFLRNAMIDGLAFFLPLPVLELIEYLHEVRMLPSYLLLP